MDPTSPAARAMVAELLHEAAETQGETDRQLTPLFCDAI